MNPFNRIRHQGGYLSYTSAAGTCERCRRYTSAGVYMPTSDGTDAVMCVPCAEVAVAEPSHVDTNVTHSLDPA